MLARQETMQPDWFFVRVVRGTDHHAMEAFRHRGIPTYYPKIVELRPMPKRRLSRAQRAEGASVMQPVSAPLFPRYVLIQAHLGDFDWQETFRQTGAAGFACESGRPVRVRTAELAKIKSRENSGLIDGRESVRMVFGVGEQVTVTSGPFASFPAIVETMLDVAVGDLDPSLRIKVAVNIFGHSTPVDLEVWQIAKQG